MSPRTAEQAAANACQQYLLMRKINAGQAKYDAGAGPRFRDAAQHAEILELDEIRVLLTQLLRALRPAGDDFREDPDAAPLPPGVEGYGVPR